ncbi:MAG: copper-containing nitrite reductase [Nitrospinaceae bacterium]
MQKKLIPIIGGMLLTQISSWGPAHALDPGWKNFFPAMAMAAEKSRHHPGEVPAVGPGGPPHVHRVEPGKLLRVRDIARNPADVPSPITRSRPAKVIYHLNVREVLSILADGVEYVYWTYNATVPGPMLRARVGDTVELTLSNHASSTHDHSIDLHAVTGPGGGSKLTQVAPGREKTIVFQPLRPGVYIYHCASPNIPSHITNGLYGLIVIDPLKPLPPVDREFYVVQGEFYTGGPVGQKGFQKFSPQKMMAETPEYIVWNGRVHALFGDKALQARQGETIRIYLGNGGVAKVSNFHIIGEIFDKLYPEGTLEHSHASVQTTVIPAGGAAAVELKLENSGEYLLVDHALVRIERGAYGVLRVKGTPVRELLRQK